MLRSVCRASVVASAWRRVYGAAPCSAPCRRLCAAGGAKKLEEDAIAAKKAEAEDASLLFLKQRGDALGVRLSLEERKLILADADKDGDNKLSVGEWDAFLDRSARVNVERLTLTQYMQRSIDQYQGRRMIINLDRTGSVFFCMCAAHIAGQSGMHAFGSCIVGFAGGLAGGTLNNLLTGAPVGWVRDVPRIFSCVLAGLIGFYAWPLAERLYADPRWQGGPTEAPPGTYPAGVLYALESIGIGAAAVVGAQQGILAGLHPLMSACLGVSIAFGGVLRDLLCQRRVSLASTNGAESHALSAFSGAAVYVALRELHVWNCSGATAKLVHGGLPIGLRVACGFGTAVAMRAIMWNGGQPQTLFSTMERAADANERTLREWRLAG